MAKKTCDGKTLFTILKLTSCSVRRLTISIKFKVKHHRPTRNILSLGILIVQHANVFKSKALKATEKQVL